MTRLAVIGYGSRMSEMVKQICDGFEDVALAAVADPDEAGVRARLKSCELPDKDIAFYPSADAMLEFADRYDGILIGTRCYLHTPMAVKAAATGLPIFLEKPVAISWEQLEELARAFEGREDQALVSFPLRVTPLFKKVREILDSGMLGVVNQIQAFNDVPYGGIYFGEWYRNFEETGGLWLQKATHDFDCLNLLAGSRPMTIAAMMTQRIYGGDKPEGLRCSACDETATCPESPANLRARGYGGGMSVEDHGCAFGRDILNQDAGSAIILYENGLLGGYSQNFVVRRPSAGRRGARVVGYDATLDFNWKTRSIRVLHHHDKRKDETIKVEKQGGHGGGDYHLQKNFVDMTRGEAPPAATLREGIQSVAMCLCARESFHKKAFVNIPALKEFPACDTPARPVEKGG